MSGVVESSPGSNTPAESAAPTTPVETTPGSGGLEDASPQSDSPFVISDDVMNSADLDEVEIPQTAKPPEPEAPATQPEVQPKPGEAKPAAAAKPAAPAEPKPAAEVKPAVPAAEPSPQRPSVVADRQVLLQEVAKNREAIVSHLASDRFKLTKEESDLLDTDVNSAISKIMARTYYEATTSALNLIDRLVKQELPSLIDGHTQSTMTYSKAEDGFWREWPNLDPKADGPAVNQAANLYRQMNPQAPLEDAIKYVGTMVSALTGKPKVAPAAQPGPKQNGSRPFTPASGAARVVSQTQVPVDPNPFAGMGQEFE
jgi:hypothetical protein